MNFMNDIQFQREELLIGKENLLKLHNAKVAIYGIGEQAHMYAKPQKDPEQAAFYQQTLIEQYNKLKQAIYVTKDIEIARAIL